MLEGILDLVKDQVLPAIANNADIPADKRDAVAETTTSAIAQGLMEHFTSNNLSAITSLFSDEPTNSAGGNIVNSLQTSVVNALSEKVGLNKTVAAGIAAVVIPAIMNLFSKKANDPKDEGFNIESLIGALAGGGNSGGAGGLLGMLGGLFGGK